jgi:diaminopimelate epimerase
MSTKLFAVHKLVGAGNDFLFIDLFNSKTKSQISKLEKTTTRAKLAERLCRRNESLGADGLIFIEKIAGGLDFKWDFYNSDGSVAEACGNASRCAIRYAKEILGIKKRNIRFQTLGGEVRGSMIGTTRAKVFMKAPKLQHEGLEIKVEGKQWTGTFLNTGVPHFVTEAKFKNHLELEWSTAYSIQSHKIFGPQLTNVTFIEILKKNRVRAVTFERGVVNFTKACGTGAIAAAYVLSEKSKTQEKLTVEMPGGELNVTFDSTGRTCLEGEALLLSEMQVLKESLEIK